MTDPAHLPPRRRPWNRDSATRWLVLWVVLIVMFLAIWQVLQPAGPRPDDGAVEVSPSFWRQNLVTVVLLAPMGLFFVGFWSQASFVQRAVAEGSGWLAEGDFAKAEEVFAKAARRARWVPMLARAVEYNQAVARLQRGDLAGAADLFASVARAGSWNAPLAACASCHLALTYALRGDIAAATRWRDDARRRLAKSTVTAGIRLVVPFAEAIVDLREGRPEEGARRIDENAKAMEGSFIGRWSRMVRAVRAFAEDRMASPREAGAVDALVNALRPSTPGEFAALTAEWPEMRRFLETRGLGGA